MFRKRKDGNDQGYDRISRLVEERQRELAEGADDGEDLEEDTIIMHTGAFAAEIDAAEPDERPVSLFNVRGGQRLAPDQSEAPAAAGFADIPAQPLPAPGGVDAAEAEPVDLEYEPEPDLDATLPLPAWQRANADALDERGEERAAVAVPVERPAMRPPDLGRSGSGGTLVAANAVWEGKLRSDGDVRVEGMVQGEIDTAATLVIAEAARVTGTIRARNVLIGGEVEGDVFCEERLEVLPGGSARGQINSGTLVVHEGAYIDSRFQMRREAAG